MERGKTEGDRESMGILPPSSPMNEKSTTPLQRGERIQHLSDEDMWEEARQREAESWRELQAMSSFQAVDEQRSHIRVVRGMRYSPTGTPRKKNSN